MRLKEIEERLAQIKAELTTRAAELKEEEITALEKEVTALQEERAAITAAAEKRSALLARIAAGENVDDGNGGEGQQRVLRNFKGAAGEDDNDDKYGILLRRGSGRYEICSGRRIRHSAGSNTYPDRRGSGSRRGRKRQNSPYTFQSGKSGLQGNCAGTHRHRGRNDNRRHCSTERSIKAV